MSDEGIIESTYRAHKESPPTPNAMADFLRFMGKKRAANEQERVFCELAANMLDEAGPGKGTESEYVVHLRTFLPALADGSRRFVASGDSIGGWSLHNEQQNPGDAFEKQLEYRFRAHVLMVRNEIDRVRTP